MAIGERIHFFRLLRGMTQKYLGMALGFPEKSADVRLAQYETGSRTPKADLTAALAEVLDVSPHALSVPDIDSYVGLMHPPHPTAHWCRRSYQTYRPLAAFGCDGQGADRCHSYPPALSGG